VKKAKAKAKAKAKRAVASKARAAAQQHATQASMNRNLAAGGARKSNTPLIVGVTAMVVLLVALIGLVVALFYQPEQKPREEDKVKIERKNLDGSTETVEMNLKPEDLSEAQKVAVADYKRNVWPTVNRANDRALRKGLYVKPLVEYAMEKLDKHVEKYPNSPYAEQAEQWRAKFQEHLDTFANKAAKIGEEMDGGSPE